MKSKLGLALIALLAILGIYALYATSTKSTGQNTTGKLSVVASFYPMAEFARQVGGDKVVVTNLTKPGVEPHDYDPTPQDMLAVHKSKVLIYNGAGLENWVSKITGELESAGTVVVNASTGIPLLSKDSGQAASESSTNIDPHIWLDPVLAAKQVNNIKSALIQADPGSAATYEKNASAYQQQLSELNLSYLTGLKRCTRRDIVTAHQAFAYLGARYKLNVVGISGISPDEEPSPQKLSEVAQYARTNDVKYIFFETLASPKLAETIAREVGAKTLVFDPLEGLSDAQISAGDNYISMQRKNLDNLRIALDCK